MTDEELQVSLFFSNAIPSFLHKFIPPPPPLAQEMIDEADRDGDGEINQDEFLRIMKKTSLY